MSKKTVIFLTIALVLIIDQVSKFWIKTHLSYNENFAMFGIPWARIHFVENEGMAFGLSYGGIKGKYLLSIFRILMAGFLCFLLYSMWKDHEKKSLLFSFSLIVAGAIGNILDCIFYGLIFTESTYHGGEVAQLVPMGQGYAPILQGKVVDMLHFPMFHWNWPSWMPFVGGESFEFFSPIFNVADSAITVGVISIILFNRSFFLNKDKKQTKDIVPPSDIIEETNITE